MIYAILFIVLCIILYFVYQKGVSDCIGYNDQGVSLIHTGCISYLIKKYSQEYDEETASLFAEAVTNELSEYKPSNEHAQNFKKHYKDQIKLKINEIKNYDELVKILGIALYMQGYWSRGKQKTKWLNRLNELQMKGIILGQNQYSMPKDSWEFIQLAEDFKNRWTN